MKKTIHLLDYTGLKKLCFVMDMFFYSQANLDALYEQKYNFLLAAPATRNWLSALIDEQWDALNSPEAFRQDGDGSLYVASRLEKLERTLLLRPSVLCSIMKPGKRRPTTSSCSAWPNTRNCLKREEAIP